MINGGTDVPEVSGHPCVVDVLGELIRRPFVLPVERGKREFVDRMTVVFGALPGYYRVVAVDPY